MLPVEAQLPTSGRASEPESVQFTPSSVDIAIWMLMLPEFVENAYLNRALA